jgi:hypothetical protein
MGTRKGCTVNAKEFFDANLANQLLIEKTILCAPESLNLVIAVNGSIKNVPRLFTFLFEDVPTQRTWV